MCYWVDLNAPESRDTRQLAHTLRKGSIARVRNGAVGDSARSALLALLSRVISSEWLQVAALCAVMAVGGAILGAVGVLAVIGRMHP